MENDERQMIKRTARSERVIMIMLFFMILIISGIAIYLYRSSGLNNEKNSNQTTPTPSITATSTPVVTTTKIPFQITKVDMSIDPSSLSLLSCGSSAIFTYVATFHAPSNTEGGIVNFTYTTTNGRGTTPASILFSPGETTKIYTFSASGTLTADNTFPGGGGIMVTSPNQLTSQIINPTGICKNIQPFTVSSIDLSVNPATRNGLTCNATTTFVYTVTFHIPANTNGGTIDFTYTTNNGRSSTPANISVSPNETTKVYNFSVTNKITPDNTFPGVAEVISQSPNTLTSQQILVNGTCK